MEFVPDHDARTVSIPIKIVDGQVRMLYGGICLSLAHGYTGDLILPAAAIKDKKLLHFLEAENSVQVLPELSVVLLAMSRERIPAKYHGEVMELPHWVHSANVVHAPVMLIEPLALLLRGTKPGQLLNSACWVPALHRRAVSLNHAYTLLSEEMEPDRRTHTGNVFTRAHCFQREGWTALDSLRKRQEQLREQEIISYLTEPHPECAALEPPTDNAQVMLELEIAPEEPYDSAYDRKYLTDRLDDLETGRRNPEAIDKELLAFIRDRYSLRTFASITNPST